MNNKKLIIGFGILVLIGLAVSGYFYMNRNPETSQQTVKQISMNGTVSKIEADSVTITGDLSGSQKTIKFKITPETQIKKTERIITEAQVRSGKPYTPETHIVAGDTQGLVVGTRIATIIASDYSTTSSQATATLINYISYSLPVITHTK